MIAATVPAIPVKAEGRSVQDPPQPRSALQQRLGDDIPSLAQKRIACPCSNKPDWSEQRGIRHSMRSNNHGTETASPRHGTYRDSARRVSERPDADVITNRQVRHVLHLRGQCGAGGLMLRASQAVSAVQRLTNNCRIEVRKVIAHVRITQMGDARDRMARLR